jgi:hypothetical protein
MHLRYQEASMAALSYPVHRCAVCGRKGQSLFPFALLQEACLKDRVSLKAPESAHFHDVCSRRAFAALLKRAPHLSALTD